MISKKLLSIFREHREEIYTIVIKVFLHAMSLPLLEDRV